MQEMKASFHFLHFCIVILPPHDTRYIGSKILPFDTSKGLGRGKILRVCEESQAHPINKVSQK